MGLIILIASSVANLLLALLVYIKNPRQHINRTFAGLILSLVGLAATTYVSLHISAPLPFIRLTMVFAIFLVLLFRWFSLWFPDAPYHFGAHRRLELAAAFAVVVIMLSPLTFTTVTITADGNVQPSFGAGIATFFLLFLYMVGSGLSTLFRRLHRARGQERAQLLYIILATVFLFSAEFISSLLMPLLFKVSVGIALAPLFFAIFAAIISTAIVKRQLFDIRAVIARSMAYFLLLTTLVVMYAAALFVLSALFFSGNQVSHQYQLVNIALAILLAFTFPYLRRFFDRLTQRIFYRRAYDSQTVIKQLTEMLVSKTSLDTIMQKSLSILSDNIEITHAILVVLDDDKVYRVKSHGEGPVPQVDISPLQHMRKDLLNISTAAGSTKDLLNHLDVETVVRLRTPDATIGFLLAGAKSSGIIYSSQDLDLLQIAGKELAVAIQNALLYEKIKNFNETLQEKVHAATRELRRTNEKLKALDETKDDFISMASHQLRTPLTSVKGYLSMVLEGDAGEINETQKKMLDQAFISSQRMVYLIADLLNVSRLRTGKFVIEPVSTDLSTMIQEEIAQLVETADSRGIKLSYSKPKEFPELLLDETKTRQVIMNFIDNAIYYTPAGGHIEVKVAATDKHVELRVIDDGIGVPRAEQHHLFTKFYRAGNARKARPDGTGLGLFMAKKVILAQDGSIIFESKEGKGSTFGFSFPRKKLAIPVDPPQRPVALPVAK